MNVFYLDECYNKAAEYHNDRHCVKMILETCQLLCTAHWVSGNEAPYKQTHTNHPCAIWARASIDNYVWLCNLGLALCEQYELRYGKQHKTYQHLVWCMDNVPNLPDIGFTEPAQAMPDEYKCDEPVVAYRVYYMTDKRHLASWKVGQPAWYV